MIVDKRGEDEGGEGHPLPASAEAREDEIPEHLVREKGHGDDAAPPSDPSAERIAPDGARYEAEPEESQDGR